MTLLLGFACVTWTAFELSRMWKASADPMSQTAACPPDGSSFGGAQAPRRPRHFAAWDDQGRRISVEDLGQR